MVQRRISRFRSWVLEGHNFKIKWIMWLQGAVALETSQYYCVLESNVFMKTVAEGMRKRWCIDLLKMTYFREHEGRDGSRRSRRDEEANLPVTHQPRGQNVGPNPGRAETGIGICSLEYLDFCKQNIDNCIFLSSDILILNQSKEDRILYSNSRISWFLELRIWLIST